MLNNSMVCYTVSLGVTKQITDDSIPFLIETIAGERRMINLPEASVNSVHYPK